MDQVTNDLYSRQLGIIPPQKLEFPICIIGAGSIGSWLTLCLAKMGCTQLEVWDMDDVEEHNTPNQLYGGYGDPLKVGELSTLVKELSQKVIVGIPDKYDGAVLMGQLIISAVDNMETRRKIFEGNSGLDKWLIDGRMGGNAIEIYIVRLNDPKQCEAYEKTLFTDAQAIPVPCSHRSVAYNGMTIAGYISSVVAKIAMEEAVPQEIMVDMKNYLVLT